MSRKDIWGFKEIEDLELRLTNHRTSFIDTNALSAFYKAYRTAKKFMKSHSKEHEKTIETFPLEMPFSPLTLPLSPKVRGKITFDDKQFIESMIEKRGGEDRLRFAIFA